MSCIVHETPASRSRSCCTLHPVACTSDECTARWLMETPCPMGLSHLLIFGVIVGLTGFHRGTQTYKVHHSLEILEEVWHMTSIDVVCPHSQSHGPNPNSSTLATSHDPHPQTRGSFATSNPPGPWWSGRDSLLPHSLVPPSGGRDRN